MNVKVDLLPSERERPRLITPVTIFLVLLLFVLIGNLSYYSARLDSVIHEKKARIEELQKEIEQMAPLKLKIDQYKEETKKLKEEIKKLKEEN
jgi:hypothetical protein